MARKDKGEARIDVYDIIGKKFTKLNVLEYEKCWHEKTAGGDRFRHSYRCLCDCGDVISVRRQSLLSGNTKSCGCLKTGRPRCR